MRGYVLCDQHRLSRPRTRGLPGDNHKAWWLAVPPPHLASLTLLTNTLSRVTSIAITPCEMVIPAASPAFTMSDDSVGQTDGN